MGVPPRYDAGAKRRTRGRSDREGTRFVSIATHAKSQSDVVVVGFCAYCGSDCGSAKVAIIGSSDLLLVRLADLSSLPERRPRGIGPWSRPWTGDGRSP